MKIMPPKVSDLMLNISARRAESRGYINLHGFRFPFEHPRMTTRIRRALLRGSYESDEIRQINRHVAPSDRVLEIGICLGVTSLILSKIVGTRDLLLFEADPRNFELARAVFKLNSKNLDIRNSALISGHSQNETISFYSNSNPSSSSLYARNEEDVKFEVKTERFEKILDTFRPTVLCADIEGGEIDLLENCHNFGSLEKIILETHPHVTGNDAISSMCSHLEKGGFFPVDDQHDSTLVLYRIC